MCTTWHMGLKWIKVEKPALPSSPTVHACNQRVTKFKTCQFFLETDSPSNLMLPKSSYPMVAHLFTARLTLQSSRNFALFMFHSPLCTFMLRTVCACVCVLDMYVCVCPWVSVWICRLLMTRLGTVLWKTDRHPTGIPTSLSPGTVGLKSKRRSWDWPLPLPWSCRKWRSSMMWVGGVILQV